MFDRLFGIDISKKAEYDEQEPVRERQVQAVVSEPVHSSPEVMQEDTRVPVVDKKVDTKKQEAVAEMLSFDSSIVDDFERGE